MGNIFISYSRRDAEIVDQFVNTLDQADIKAWVDREDIKVGTSWRMQIVEAIDTCDAFVFMLSANSAASTNVHKEIILAQDSARPIYVVMLEVVRLPPEIRYQLAGLQFINFPLIGFDKSAEKLVEVLTPHVKKNDEITHKQTELVIQGIDISAFTAEKQEQLLAFISTLANADASQLKIANLAPGSVHAFVNMPAEVAYQLKTRALNRDPRFSQLGITSLRLSGDTQFINISLGLLTATATISLFKYLWLKTQSYFSSVFGMAMGNIMMGLTSILIIAGIGFSALFLFQPPQTTPASIPAETGSNVPELASTLTATATATETDAQKIPLAQTAIPTDTPEPVYEVFNGVVQFDRVACRYGPGDLYLYQYGLIKDNNLQVLGRDINSGWAYAQAQGYEKPCWINLRYISFDGDVASLENLYPGKVKIPQSIYWPAPQNVYTARTRAGDQVAIYWDEYILPDGEMESPDSPRYLAELWLCQNGQLTFNSIFAWQNNLLVTDEPGCSEPSQGVIYLVEKHGYAGPVEIIWSPVIPPAP